MLISDSGHGRFIQVPACSTSSVSFGGPPHASPEVEDRCVGPRSQPLPHSNVGDMDRLYGIFLLTRDAVRYEHVDQQEA